MEAKLDKIGDKLDSQSNRLTSIETDLKHHIKRSDQLETIVQRHEKYFWMAMGILTVAGPLINIALTRLFK